MSDLSANEKNLSQAFVDSWLHGFLEAFEAQAGIQIAEGEGLPATPIAGEYGLIGLEQALDQPSGAAFWIGVTEPQAGQVGKLLLGEADAEETAFREALFNILRSSLEAAVQTVAAQFRLGNTQPVESKTFSSGELSCFTPVRFSGPDIEFEIYLGISPQLQQSMDARAAAQPSAVPSGSGLDQLFDFELPVSFSFGRKKLALRDVLKLAPSAVVELDRAPDDLVEVIVNDSVIAWGEVVSIDGQYGIRIRRIASGGLQSPPMNSGPSAPIIRGMVEA